MNQFNGKQLAVLMLLGSAAITSCSAVGSALNATYYPPLDEYEQLEIGQTLAEADEIGREFAIGADYAAEDGERILVKNDDGNQVRISIPEGHMVFASGMIRRLVVSDSDPEGREVNYRVSTAFALDDAGEMRLVAKRYDTTDGTQVDCAPVESYLCRAE